MNKTPASTIGSKTAENISECFNRQSGSDGLSPKDAVHQVFIDRHYSYTFNVNMATLRFEWNETKNRENKRKHRVSFEEAQTVFLDENAIRYYDPDHSDDEGRFLMMD